MADSVSKAAPPPMHTRITELFGIRYPIVQGGLAHLSFSGLAAAVSEAGGLGQIGMACFETPEELREDIRRLKQLTSLPFGVNFPLGHRPVAPFVDVALEEGAHVISITAGNPEGVLRQIAASGVKPLPKTMVLVAGTRAARKAQDLGADAVIAVGYEGGGHLGREDVGTLVLTPKIVQTVSIPVLASGGIMDGSGMAAGLALGAEGVELGTRFIATQECVAHQNYKEALVGATEADTVIIERTLGRPARVLRRGPLVERIIAAEDDLTRRNASREEAFETLFPLIRGEVNKVAALEGRLDEGFIWAGEGIGLITDIPTARELIERMVREATSATERLRAMFG
ncbi:MAG TPA: nitronate monooxygenase [Ktedonobacterales bacterium]|nr:nitronate monooxygenase [Ktedonobacterales bacterium]